MRGPNATVQGLAVQACFQMFDGFMQFGHSYGGEIAGVGSQEEAHWGFGQRGDGYQGCSGFLGIADLFSVDGDGHCESRVPGGRETGVRGSRDDGSDVDAGVSGMLCRKLRRVDIDDMARALCAEAWQGGADDDGGFPGISCVIAGVVDDDVEAAESFPGGVDRGGHGGFVGGVEFEGQEAGVGNFADRLHE